MVLPATATFTVVSDSRQTLGVALFAGVVHSPNPSQFQVSDFALAVMRDRYPEAVSKWKFV